MAQSAMSIVKSTSGCWFAAGTLGWTIISDAPRGSVGALGWPNPSCRHGKLNVCRPIMLNLKSMDSR
jgi:hypothetical protein